MDTVTYRIPPHQRRKYLRWGVGLWLPPIVCLAVSRSPAALVLAGLFAALALAADLVYLDRARGRTVVSDHGIASQRPFGSASWTWAEVESVRAEKVDRGRGGVLRCVVVRSVDGRERRLAVPYSEGGVADETFEQTANGIVADWRVRTFGSGLSPRQ